MKKESLKLYEVRSEASEKNDFMVEKLDFSELAAIRGGDKKPDQPTGHAGGIVCGCKGN